MVHSTEIICSQGCKYNFYCKNLTAPLRRPDIKSINQKHDFMTSKDRQLISNDYTLHYYGHSEDYHEPQKAGGRRREHFSFKLGML